MTDKTKQACPWCGPGYSFGDEGCQYKPIADKPAADREALAEALAECTGHSGWWARTVTDSLLASGVIRDAAEVRAEALATVEAVFDEQRPYPYSMAPFIEIAKVRAAVSGHSSALDAELAEARADERERIAQEIEAKRQQATHSAEDAAYGVALRIAREGGGGGG